MNNFTITAIIPTYNRVEFLPRSIESILNQSHKVDQIIVVDDGSTDNTKDIVSRYNVEYLYQDNSGVSSARNLGIKHSKSDYIAFLDSDDEWHKDKIKKQVEFHNQNPNIYISHSDEKWIRDNKEIKKKGLNIKKSGHIFLDSIKNCTIGCSTVMIKSSIFDDVGLFDESLEVCEDYDLWLRITHKYEIGLLQEQLTTKYAGHEQLSFKYWGMDRWRVQALEKMIDKKSKYKNEIINEIIDKSKVLANGAKKRDNIETYEYYYNKIESLKALNIS
jgi:glycosyltransferase involved in cell wall biosynthesis